MFKDKEWELQRLEEALLQEEQEEQAEKAEEQRLDALLDAPTDFGEEKPDTYRNFSNHYGYVPVYNTDTVDEDLEEYSEVVYAPEKKSVIPGLIAVNLALLAGIFCVLAWLAIRFLG